MHPKSDNCLILKPMLLLKSPYVTATKYYCWLKTK